MNYELLIIFASIIIGGVSVLYIKMKASTLKLLLSFSGAYLLSICALHLLPELFSDQTKSVGGFILLGYFVQIAIEYFSHGIEHGHAHIHDNKKRVLPLSLLIALGIHSIIEGMPLAESHHDHTHRSLLLGILLHKIPIAIALVTLLVQLELPKSKVVGSLIIFASMTPIGALMAEYFIDLSVGNIKQVILAIAVGIFLHISTTILLESSENHRFNYYKLLSMMLGAILAFLF